MQTIAVGLVLAVLANGCSLIFVRPLPSGPRARASGCTTNKVAPVLDTMFASWQAIRIGIAAGASDDAYRGAALNRESDMLVGVLLGVVGMSSAIYGFNAVNECRSAGENVRPYAPARQRTRTSAERAAEEAAEEAAVQARLKARAAEAAKSAAAAEGADDGEPDVSPAPAAAPDGGRD